MWLDSSGPGSTWLNGHQGLSSGKNSPNLGMPWIECNSSARGAGCVGSARSSVCETSWTRWTFFKGDAKEWDIHEFSIGSSCFPGRYASFYNDIPLCSQSVTKTFQSEFQNWITCSSHISLALLKLMTGNHSITWFYLASLNQWQYQSTNLPRKSTAFRDVFCHRNKMPFDARPDMLASPIASSFGRERRPARCWNLPWIPHNSAMIS